MHQAAGVAVAVSGVVTADAVAANFNAVSNPQQDMEIPMNRILGLAVAAVAATSFAASYDIDPAHSQASFTVKHMKVATVRGAFKKLSGTVNIDEKDITKSSVEAKADAASIDTNEAKRDEHLRGEEFFDVKKCPDVTFKSTRVAKGGKSGLKVTGDLTMHCVTRPVTFAVEGPTPEIKGPWGNTVRALTATATINRKDFGLNWNKSLEAGGVLVSDEVNIELVAELNPSKAPEAEKDTAKLESKDAAKAAEKQK